MKILSNLSQPTLVRRVFLALLVAFCVVWFVLLALEYLQVTNPKTHNKNARAITASLLASISHIDNASEARATIAIESNLIISNYHSENLPAVMLLQLSDKNGKLLFLSPEANNKPLIGTLNEVTDQTIEEKSYKVFKGETANWSLVVAKPYFKGLWVIEDLLGNLTIYILVAFPIVLLPIWMAVSRGLLPLQLLSNRIAAKSLHDLTALNFDPKYAELKPLVLALDGLLSQLRTKISREHAFVQDAAHELRTPMAVISAQAHVLAMSSTPTARQIAEQRMDQAIARASHLIQQLLQLASVDGTRQIDVQLLDVVLLVRQELALIVPSAMERDIDVSLSSLENLMITLEADSFQAIVHNLLTNAVRYVQPGGQVIVELKQTVSSIVLSVADNGPGIAEHERELVFERFYRGIGHETAGSGLGLAIVKQAAQRLGGSVELFGGLEGKGCNFVVTIPFTINLHLGSPADAAIS